MALIDHLMGDKVEGLRVLVEIVTREDRKHGTDHRATLYWFVFGPDLGEALTGRELREPSYGEFSTLTLLVELKAPEWRPLFEQMALYSPMSAMLAVQMLVAAKEPWAHPSQVLESPRPSPEALLSAFRRRVAEGDKDPGLLAIHDRLQRAVRVEMRAAQRRRQRIEEMRDTRVRVGNSGRIAAWALGNLTGKEMSREEVMERLSQLQMNPEGVDDAFANLGARTMGTKTIYCLEKSLVFNSQRSTTLFILREVGMREMKMSSLARRAYLERVTQRITRDSFIAVASWVLRLADGRSSGEENRLKKSAATCWDGVAAKES